jgi:amino acid transporter
VFYSAIAGWALLLALLFAANHVSAINAGGGGAIPLVNSDLSAWAAKFILIIFTVGQLFCGAAGLTSASRTWYAFSRDRGMPGWWLFRRLTAKRVPLYAVLAVSVAALIITIPAYFGTKTGVPWAYFAITAICTVGLYLAYILPVYLRLRAGSSFQTGVWSLGKNYKWVNIGAIAFVVLVVYALDGPTSAVGAPWNHGFTWTAFNYSPLVLLVGLIVGIWWWTGAKNRYHGPVRTIDDVEFETTPPATPPSTAIAGGSE